jgi:ATPase subunit of ABC transporter with duplicated ATPase domains
VEALRAGPDFLFLDEPTHDLDASGFDGGLVVVSHDRRILRTFEDFLVASETGCEHVRGTFADVLAHLEDERQRVELAYVRTLHRLADQERQDERVRRRRQRKKNLGRLHEIRRAPSRAKLNSKRGYAQESQGKRAVLQRARLEAARTWAKATRRALGLDLPLDLSIPTLPGPSGDAIVTLDDVAAETGGRTLFSGMSLHLDRQRLAVIGPNGSGKSTLLEIISGDRSPSRGRSRSDTTRIGYVAQDASNWCRAESLFDELARTSELPNLEAVAQTLLAHRFPLALAERPLGLLSPGERLRAALICLLGRRPAPVLLVLDEPTAHLDLLGLAAVERLLASWPGGLVVASHDRELLDAIGIAQRIDLGVLSP